MIRSRLAVIVPIATALTLVSCGRTDGPALYPVQGKVMYKGQPAVGATVILRRLDPEPNTTPPVPAGQVDDQGSFSVSVDQMGEGVPAGKYAALILWRTKVEGGEPPKPAPKPKKGRRYVPPVVTSELIPDRLAGRYMDPERSPFRVEVKTGDNNLEPFDVSK
jgi:hypothetical protein